ncbi:MAG: hypothetical protein HY880_00240 [Deltaproteobacteria bacterium]|nr:hypothetical protein [Deltaproteobacteria bacterium]
MDTREDIEKLDMKIKRLKVEYDQYFMRALKREPLSLRQEVERIIVRYAEANITNTAQKFRYQNLAQKYGVYKQHWANVLKAKEDGRYVKKAGGWSVLKKEAEGEGQDLEEKMPFRSGEDDSLLSVYNAYIEARTCLGQPFKGITFERFKDKIEENLRKAEDQYSTKDLELRVVVKDGKVSVRIFPRKG